MKTSWVALVLLLGAYGCSELPPARHHRTENAERAHDALIKLGKLEAQESREIADDLTARGHVKGADVHAKIKTDSAKHRQEAFLGVNQAVDRIIDKQGEIHGADSDVFVSFAEGYESVDGGRLMEPIDSWPMLILKAIAILATIWAFGVVIGDFHTGNRGNFGWPLAAIAWLVSKIPQKPANPGAPTPPPAPPASKK